MINLKSRLKNPIFIIGIAGLVIPYLLSLGFKFDGNWVMDLVKGLCGILAFVGVMSDTSTPGLFDKIETVSTLPAAPDATTNSIAAKTVEQNTNPI